MQAIFFIFPSSLGCGEIPLPRGTRESRLLFWDLSCLHVDRKTPYQGAGRASTVSPSFLLRTPGTDSGLPGVPFPPPFSARHHEEPPGTCPSSFHWFPSIPHGLPSGRGFSPRIAFLTRPCAGAERFTPWSG